MVYAAPVVGTDGAGGGTHSHSYSSATCTEAPTCSCGATSGSALGHSWGPAATCTTAQKCKTCGTIAQNALGHSYGDFYSIGSANHRHDCKRSGCSHYETFAHNKNIKENIGDKNQHKTYCDKCNQYMGLEKHSWPTDPGSKHTCTHGCGYTHTEHPDHMYPVSNGDDLVESLSYSCELTDGDGCGCTVTISAPSAIKGLNIGEYAASDAVAKMGTVPAFPNGTYDFSFSGILRDRSGNPITSLNMPENWVRLFGWGQKNVMSHTTLDIYKTYSQAQRSTDLLEKTDYSIEQYREAYGPIMEDDWYNMAYASIHLVTTYLNDVENKKVKEWPDDMKSTAEDLIKNGSQHDPTVTFIAGGTQKFQVVYNVGSGGWFFWDSPFFPNKDLFQSGGGYSKEGPQTIKSNVYYCYRTLDNQIPNNGYQHMYIHSSIVTYSSGHSSQTVNVAPDMGLIDRTGYRYKGLSVSIGSIGGVSVSKAPPKSTDTSVNVTVSSWANQSAAIVTFFVEPVKLTYGHQVRNAADGDGEQLLDLNVPSHQRLLSDFGSTDKNKKPLEFPDYYSKADGRCYIPVDKSFSQNPDPLESLYKYAWPGFILEESRVYKTSEGILGSVIGGTKKKYYEDMEPYTTILEDASRHIVNERIPSYYDSETRGLASDKHFTYVYNTPTLEIEHKYYKTNDYMQADSHKINGVEKGVGDIKYTTQIVNQFAYIDSLVTDNVKDEYIMSIRNSNEQVESFTYKYPRYDLVAVRISEKKGDSEVHYATLYEEDTYRDKMVKDSRYESDKNAYYKVKDYEGVFGKYYSDSLNSIAMQIKEELETRKGVSKADKEKLKEVFNTNKNWKVEFIYDEVDRVYIKFKDLKGNSIFIESGDHYIGEITTKLPESPKVFEYEVKNLGTNDKFLLVKYVSGDTNYKADFLQALSQAEDTTAPHLVKESAGNGDKHYIFYYLTGNMLKVEYRDKDDNPIKDPLITEIPSTGEVVDIPKIDLYELIGYKHNPDYDWENEEISDDMINLTPSDEEISIPNPNETDHHVIIYYQPKETLTVKYKELPDKILMPVPPKYNVEDKYEIPEDGMKIKVPEVPGYKVNGYIYDREYTGIDPDTVGGITITQPTEAGRDINVHSNEKNQLIIIYYEKEMTDPIDLTIKFVEEDPDDPDGKPDMEKDPLKDPVTIEIPKGEDIPIPVPDIDEYIPVSYIEGEPPIDPIPKPEKLDEGEPVVSGDGPIEVILIYRPDDDEPEIPDPQEPTIITPEDNMEKAFLHANNSNNFGSEEYTVEVAIPTSEDLYVSGDVYSYRFTTKMPQVEEKEKVKVQVIQYYYTNLDSTRKEDYGEVKTDILDIELSYKYYDIQEAYLYDLKSLHLENGAIKYYDNYDYANKTEHGYSEEEANFKIRPKPEPKIVYEPTVRGVAAVGKDEDSNVRVQITSGNGYTVKYEGGIYKIYIDDIDYYNYEELAGKDSLKEQLEIEAQAIIEKCTQIKTQKLYIQMDGTDNVDILTGKKYRLPERSEALNSAEYYIPYVAGRTPLYSFLEDKDLYVMEQAQNKLYSSTLEGNYRLIDAIKNNIHLDTDEKLKNEALYDNKLTVEKIAVNPLNVHTPIRKDVTLTPNNDKTQLKNDPSESGVVDYVLNLEETFDITIKNSGMHLNQKGYGERSYNNLGLMTGTEEKDHTPELYEPTIEGRKTIKQKSLDELMPLGSFENREIAAKNPRDEELAKGPSFAEYKLIRFPYDVYLTKTDANSPTTGGPQLFKANVWYNLNEYVKPSQETYTFALPTWVKDATAYMDEEGNGIYVLVVAENCPIDPDKEDILDKALANPMSVSEANANTLNKDTTYILRQSYSTYVSGRLYDLQIRDTDDPGYMNKIKPALKGVTTNPDNVYVSNEMPIAQQGQVAAYKMGLKLGYRFYFDLKTKGVSNKNITIIPNIYYVSKDGRTVKSLADKEISLFYHTKGTLYNKLTKDSDLGVRMTMAGTHGTINNPGYTQETISASQLATRDFRSQLVIGEIVEGLNLIREKVKLPYDNIVEIAKACGYTGTDAEVRTGLLNSVLNNATTAGTVLTNENMIKDATGHWYGEYYLPATTYVYNGDIDRTAVVNGSAKSSELKDGYLVVVFEEITTEDDVVEGNEDTISPNYLTYAAPSGNSQWVKEGVDTAFILPNGVEATITHPGTSNLIEAGAMAIYQVGLRANNDFEIEGTH